MDQKQEQRFIKAFIRRERRDRAQFELASSTKRMDFVDRLCHRYSEMLDARYMHPLELPNSSYHDILAQLRRAHATDHCYCISRIPDLDGQWLVLKHALARAVGFGLPTIIIALPERLCYFEAEQERGPAPRFLLERR